MLAFEHAVRAGADAIELDVHVSADGQVVVCHDPTVDRTTGSPGTIAAMPWSRISALEAGAPGARIPRLAEVLATFSSLPILVEIKTVSAAIPTVAIIQAADARDRAIVGSFHGRALKPARAAGLQTCASRFETMRLALAGTLGMRLRRVPFVLASTPTTWMGRPAPVRQVVRAATVPVFVWTVNEPARAMRYWQAGATGVITDDVPAMVAARDALPG